MKKLIESLKSGLVNEAQSDGLDQLLDLIAVWNKGGKKVSWDRAVALIGEDKLQSFIDKEWLDYDRATDHLFVGIDAPTRWFR